MQRYESFSLYCLVRFNLVLKNQKSQSSHLKSKCVQINFVLFKFSVIFVKQNKHMKVAIIGSGFSSLAASAI